MTWRVVALGSAEARDPRLGATATERLEMFAELSRLPWSASGRAVPEYARSAMPVFPPFLTPSQEFLRNLGIFEKPGSRVRSFPRMRKSIEKGAP